MMIGLRDVPLDIRVRAILVLPTDDESERNIVPTLGEVSINGIPVFGVRRLSHRSTPPGTGEEDARRAAGAGFAVALRTVLGYDPEAARA